MTVFTKRLKTARKHAGLSQEKLGILAGMDEMSASARMNQYERGKHVPDFSIVEKLASVLQLPSAYFYASDDDLANLIKYFHQLNSIDKKRTISILRIMQNSSLTNQEDE